MKIRDLKKWVNELNEKQLDQELLYNSDDLSISGVVASIEKATENLYFNGEDDPSPLYTKKQLREMGVDSEEIAEQEIEIAKGDFYIKF